MKYFIIGMLSLQLMGCAKPIANLDSKGENIICFGNSLTEGLGVGEGDDYPAQLSQRLGVPIINAGISGETTRDALKRVKGDVLRKDPYLVIVEFSANDSMQRFKLQETLDNIDSLVQQIQEVGAIVVLVHVKAQFLGDAYLKGFKEIAKRRKAVLVKNMLEGILQNPNLKIDRFHPNAQGYQLIADKIYKAVKPLLKSKLAQ